MTPSTPLLAVEDIEVVYAGAVLVLKGVSLTVAEGGIVALLGANGAGKSTTLKAISNVLRAERGAITRGRVTFMGERIDGRDPADLVAMGVTQVLEGRRLFQHLTVEENLRAGAYARRDAAAIRGDLDRVYAHFPALPARRSQKAGYLSGGEQQMVAIGRALMARPRLMLLDEPSMGLAPMLTREIFAIVARLRETEKLSILLAEQNANLALGMVDHGYVLENGRVALAGAAAELRANEEVKHFYLGLSEVGASGSYRDLVLEHRQRRTESVTI